MLEMALIAIALPTNAITPVSLGLAILFSELTFQATDQASVHDAPLEIDGDEPP